MWIIRDASVSDIFLGLGDDDSASAKEVRMVGSWRVSIMLSAFISISFIYILVT